MKKVKMSLIALCAIAVVGCKKEVVKVDNAVQATSTENVFVQHKYTYEKEQYEIIYEFNSKNEIVDCKGDVTEYKSLTEKLKKNSKLAFLIESSDEKTKTHEIRIFDSPQKLDEYCKIIRPNSIENRSVTACDNMTNPGNRTFSFYRDINMQNEFVYLRRPFCSFFQQQWLDAANDQISSLQITGGNGFVDLFGDSCYYGIQYRTYHDIPNLHTVLVGYYWYGGAIFGGDWCSSLKGYQY